MRRNCHNTTSGIKSDHAVRSGIRKPICLWNCGWKRYFKGTLRLVCTAHAQKGQNTTSGFRFDHAIRSGMVENLYSHEILAKNAILGDFEPYFTAHAQKRPEYYFRYQIWPRHSIRHVTKTYIYAKSWLKTRFCGYCSWMSIFALSLHWRFSAHARKTGSCCPILTPNELVLTIRVSNDHAKFGDDRLRIADARVVTDGQTGTHMDTFC